MSRRTTYATLNNWSPKRAHNFAMSRIEKMKHMLVEIGAAYGDVDDGIVRTCDELVYGAFDDLIEALDGALAEGRRL